MRRSRSAPVALLLACLAWATGPASAGELADLHRELVGSSIVPLAPGVPAGTPATGEDTNDQGAAGPGGESAQPPAPGVPGIRQLAPVPQRAPVPDIERVGYEALRCRGFCAAFTVIIAADGTFEYVGEANVERLGRHTGRLDSFAVEQLLRFVDAIDYASLRDTYASPFADVQTTYTMVDYAGADVKVVQDQGGSAPVTVWALGRLIESLLANADWD